MGGMFDWLQNGVNSLVTGVSTALTPQNNFDSNSPVNVGALNNQIGLSQGNFQQNYQNQNALAQALLAQSQGQGPNPAQAMFNQNLNQSIKENSGYLASQKGINPGLAARLSAQNAASMSQNAASQGAIMSAEQQLGAQNSLSGLYNTIGNQNLQNIQTSGNLANTGGLGAQQINAGVSAQNAAANQNTAGGILNSLGPATKLFGAYKGGQVPGYDVGGTVGGYTGYDAAFAALPSFQTSAPDTLPGLGTFNSPTMGAIDGSGGGAKQPAQLIGPSNASQDIANKILAQGGVTMYPAGNAQSAKQQSSGGDSQIQQMLPYLASAAMAKGGKVMPAHLHHIAQVYYPNFGAKNTSQLKANGGPVPGKAKVQGDSPKNDTVKAMLSPGELVIPRSIMNSKDPVKAGADFIAQELKKKGSHAQDKSDFQEALKKAIGSRGK